MSKDNRKNMVAIIALGVASLLTIAVFLPPFSVPLGYQTHFGIGGMIVGIVAVMESAAAFVLAKGAQRWVKAFCLSCFLFCFGVAIYTAVTFFTFSELH